MARRSNITTAADDFTLHGKRLDLPVLRTANSAYKHTYHVIKPPRTVLLQQPTSSFAIGVDAVKKRLGKEPPLRHET